MKTDNKYSIKAVSNLTGLSEFVIRIWEKRYAAVTPTRTDTNRRIYTKEDVDKLSLLHQATKKGHAIGNIYSLTIEQLQNLISDNHFIDIDEEIKDPQNYDDYLALAFASIHDLDPERLESVLQSASIHLTQNQLLSGVLIPLIQRIGTKWEMGDYRVSNEHFASVIIIKFLNNYWESFKIPGNAPRILISAPMGQQHEFGALLCAVIASSRGWKVIYFGPNLPVPDIVAAANQLSVKAVALSFVYPPGDLTLKNELEKLKFLNRDIILFAGGRVVNSYQDILLSLNTVILNDVFELKTKLDSIN